MTDLPLVRWLDALAGVIGWFIMTSVAIGLAFALVYWALGPVFDRWEARQVIKDAETLRYFESRRG